MIEIILILLAVFLVGCVIYFANIRREVLRKYYKKSMDIISEYAADETEFISECKNNSISKWRIKKYLKDSNDSKK